MSPADALLSYFAQARPSVLCRAGPGSRACQSRFFGASPEELAWASFRSAAGVLLGLVGGVRRGYRYMWIWIGGVGVWRMVGRRLKEKDLMVGQIVFYMVVAAAAGRKRR